MLHNLLSSCLSHKNTSIEPNSVHWRLSPTKENLPLLLLSYLVSVFNTGFIRLLKPGVNQQPEIKAGNERIHLNETDHTRMSDELSSIWRMVESQSHNSYFKNTHQGSIER